MEDQLHKYLHHYFGFQHFRVGQKDIIQEAMQGCNILGILPTGTGKSICYQLPARLLPGAVIVVSPLISLMTDQVKQMKAAGFKEVIAFNSFMDFMDKKAAMRNLNTYKLIYASPEMLQNDKFINSLKEVPISMFVIDEAHCISQWGHEFRPDYLKLSSVIQKLKNPPVMALSATATPEVQEDIINQLKLKQVNKHIYPMDRKNITLVVRKVDNNDTKIDGLVHQLSDFPGPSMIYFSSRDWTEKATRSLKNRLPELNIAYYHGGMDQEDRILVQQQFMNGQLDVICCTSAFGMGIDKQDIRLVAHFHLPGQIESFIQEIGRAGRDGEQSVSLVFVAPNDDFIPRKLMETELPQAEDIERIIGKIRRFSQENTKLPDEPLLLSELDLNEIQWRFLRFHLENHQLIGKYSQEKNTMRWKQAAAEIKEIITRRQHYKQDKLSQLLQWAYGTTCRRKNLFEPFQDSIQKPEADCCDICGFQLENWKTVYQLPYRTGQNWKKEFRNLMLRGTVYGEDE